MNPTPYYPDAAERVQNAADGKLSLADREPSPIALLHDLAEGFLADRIRTTKPGWTWRLTFRHDPRSELTLTPWLTPLDPLWGPGSGIQTAWRCHGLQWQATLWTEQWPELAAWFDEHRGARGDRVEHRAKVKGGLAFDPPQLTFTQWKWISLATVPVVALLLEFADHPESFFQGRTQCFLCGRGLSDQASIARGVGSECIHRVGRMAHYISDVHPATAPVPTEATADLFAKTGHYGPEIGHRSGIIKQVLEHGRWAWEVTTAGDGVSVSKTTFGLADTEQDARAAIDQQLAA